MISLYAFPEPQEVDFDTLDEFEKAYDNYLNACDEWGDRRRED